MKRRIYADSEHKQQSSTAQYQYNELESVLIIISVNHRSEKQPHLSEERKGLRKLQIGDHTSLTMLAIQSCDTMCTR